MTYLIDKNLDNEFSTSNGHVSTFGLKQNSLRKDAWRLLSPREMVFRENLEKNAWKLGELCDIGMGMQTGFDKAFRVTKEEIEKEGIPYEFVRKLVRNGDIRRNISYDRNEFWIYTEDLDVDSLKETHPVKKHLIQYKEKLKERYPSRTCGHCSKTFKTFQQLEEHWKLLDLPIDEQIPKRKWFQYTVPNLKKLCMCLAVD